MAENRNYLPEHGSFATSSIHDFQHIEQWNSMSVVTPLVLSTNFKQYGPGDYQKYFYGRCGAPNRELLQNCLAQLDEGKYGLCWSSGMAAISAVAGLLNAGDHIICEDDIYETTSRLFHKVCSKYNITVTSAHENDFEKSIQENTKMIWIESLSNPTMKVLDMKKVSEIAHKNNLLLVVDNTFVSSYFHHPLNFGADIAVYSLTKYVNGHSDVIMGATITNSDEIHEKLRFIQETMGSIPSPFDCYLVSRSIKTLALRMKQHMKNSIEVAKFLEKHPKVEKVLHPGLASHPQHEIFKKQTSGFSGMLAFYIKDANLDDSKRFMTSLKVFVLATSLGDLSSLVELPSVMSHLYIPEDKKKILKITDNMVRVSVGIEDLDDLIRDLDQALNQV